MVRNISSGTPLLVGAVSSIFFLQGPTLAANILPDSDTAEFRFSFEGFGEGELLFGSAEAFSRLSESAYPITVTDDGQQLVSTPLVPLAPSLFGDTTFRFNFLELTEADAGPVQVAFTEGELSNLTFEAAQGIVAADAFLTVGDSRFGYGPDICSPGTCPISGDVTYETISPFAVPEPLTILGSAVALAMGAALKRRSIP